ncbi:DUF4347 domain-containing protein [Stieleria marina]|uniref:DUF4347 domain-containing protein n=1 Tax=Stieleria marina TaxID=1930275 RepID=UPI003AF3E47D
MTPLEPRILLAGDTATAVGSLPVMPTDSLVGTEVDTELTRQGSQDNLASASGRSIVFIDSRIEDADVLLAGMDQGAEWILVDRQSDAIEQITQHLQHRRNVSAVHLVSHGQRGQLVMGNGGIDQSSLRAASDSIRQWKASLTRDADILIYGCDAGAGETGLRFAKSFAALSGADVAISTDVTGNDEGADWNLELHIGLIDASLAFNEAARQSYAKTMASVKTIASKSLQIDDPVTDNLVGDRLDDFLEAERTTNENVLPAETALVDQEPAVAVAETLTTGVNFTEVLEPIAAEPIAAEQVPAELPPLPLQPAVDPTTDTTPQTVEPVQDTKLDVPKVAILEALDQSVVELIQVADETPNTPAITRPATSVGESLPAEASISMDSVSLLGSPVQIGGESVIVDSPPAIQADPVAETIGQVQPLRPSGASGPPANVPTAKSANVVSVTLPSAISSLKNSTFQSIRSASVNAPSNAFDLRTSSATRSSLSASATSVTDANVSASVVRGERVSASRVVTEGISAEAGTGQKRTVSDRRSSVAEIREMPTTVEVIYGRGNKRSLKALRSESKLEPSQKESVSDDALSTGSRTVKLSDINQLAAKSPKAEPFDAAESVGDNVVEISANDQQTHSAPDGAWDAWAIRNSNTPGPNAETYRHIAVNYSNPILVASLQGTRVNQGGMDRSVPDGTASDSGSKLHREAFSIEKEASEMQFILSESVAHVRNVNTADQLGAVESIGVIRPVTQLANDAVSELLTVENTAQSSSRWLEVFAEPQTWIATGRFDRSALPVSSVSYLDPVSVYAGDSK